MNRPIGNIHRQDQDKPFINIVLFQPEIPQNTGTIGRLCVCVNARLHLVKPLGFELDESRIRRAGLDYWPHLDLTVHESWDEFMAQENPENLCFVTTKTEQPIFSHNFCENEYLVFGKESSGLPDHFYDDYEAALVTIPMPGPHARSHNLANSVSITAYEAWRQLRFEA